jgi:pyruvate dehydrogenase E1 component
VIVHNGMQRMVQNQESVFFYITAMNENYLHPAMPEGAAEGIIKGMYKFASNDVDGAPRATLLGGGTILREVIAAGEMLASDWNVASDVWSVTSFNELRRDGLDAERWNRLHPDAEPRSCYISDCLASAEGPVIASTDYMKIYADQIRQFVPGRYEVLGTDGFGRSDTREALREFFEVNRYYVVIATLKALADEGKVEAKLVSDAIAKYGINPDKANPVTV